MKASARRCRLLVAAGLLLLPSLAAAAEPVWIGKFPPAEQPIPAPWAVERFDPKVPPTRYRLRSWDGVDAVEASADASMAVLVRPVAVDLAATPVLCWRWRIAAPLVTADIATKAGDDYAARVYLMFRVPAAELDFSTRAMLAMAKAVRGEQVPDAALNYVWDNKSPVDTVRPSAYTEQTMMWVLRTGAGDVGRWVDERRQVLADFRRAFGYAPSSLYAVAVASDTDNTGERATAGFADLHFVAESEPCR